MKKLWKSPVFRYVLLGLLAVMIGVNVYAMNANRLAGNQVPMPFGYGAAVVLSGSMEPTLSVGDLLIVKQQDSYEINDIVVYQSGSMPVVHRIVDITQEQAITQGDANNAADEPIPLQAIRGSVIGAVPLIGHLVWALKSPVALVIMLVASVLLVEFSFRTGREEKEAEKEKLKEEIRLLMKELEE